MKRGNYLVQNPILRQREINSKNKLLHEKLLGLKSKLEINPTHAYKNIYNIDGKKDVPAGQKKIEK